VESVLECLPRGARVAVIRLRSLGDCVLTTPALDILKRDRPDLRLAVAVEPKFQAVFEELPFVDEILAPGLGGLRRFRPSLCLNLHGGTRSAWMTMGSAARFRAGFAHFRNQAAYNVRIPRAQKILGVERTVHTAEHLASAMFYLGAPVVEIPRATLSARPATATARCVIHPAAAMPEKTWPAARFLEIAEHVKRSGLEPVFIGGPTDDLAPFRAFRMIQGAPLSEIKSLLAGSSLFLGNDSGPAHMAAAFGLPVVVLFGASDSAIWGPWRTASEIVSAPGGIASVPVSAVLDALARLRVHA
jgi:ADP-heptose:LPS heptosyltransferase